MRLRIISFFLLVALLLPLMSFAQTNPCKQPPPGATASIAKCVTQVYRWSLGAAAILALLMMVLGGYRVMAAGGNAQQAGKGKEMIMSAIVGLGLLFGAYIILNTINPDLVQLRDVPPPGPTAPRN